MQLPGGFPKRGDPRDPGHRSWGVLGPLQPLELHSARSFCSFYCIIPAFKTCPSTLKHTGHAPPIGWLWPPTTTTLYLGGLPVAGEGTPKLTPIGYCSRPRPQQCTHWMVPRPWPRHSHPLDVVFGLLADELDALQHVGDVIDAPLLHFQHFGCPV